MRRIIVTILIAITCFVLQGTLFKTFSFGNVSPNLVLVFVVSFALMRGKKTGIVSGFCLGILSDIFLMPVIGFYALLFMYIGYFAGSFNKVFFKEDVKLPIALIAGSDILYGFACYCFMFLLRGRLNIGYYFVNVCIPECIFTMVITVIFYPLFLMVDHLLLKGERKQERKFV